MFTEDDREQISAYLDNEVAAPFKNTIEERIASDDEARGVLEGYRNLHRSLAGAPEPSFDGARRRVWRSLDARIALDENESAENSNASPVRGVRVDRKLADGIRPDGKLADGKPADGKPADGIRADSVPAARSGGLGNGAHDGFGLDGRRKRHAAVHAGRADRPREDAGAAGSAGVRPLWRRRVSLPVPVVAAAAAAIVTLATVFSVRFAQSVAGAHRAELASQTSDGIQVTINVKDVQQLLDILNGRSSNIKEVKIELPQSQQFQLLGEPVFMRVGDSAKGYR